MMPPADEHFTLLSMILDYKSSTHTHKHNNSCSSPSQKSQLFPRPTKCSPQTDKRLASLQQQFAFWTTSTKSGNAKCARNLFAYLRACCCWLCCRRNFCLLGVRLLVFIFVVSLPVSWCLLKSLYRAFLMIEFRRNGIAGAWEAAFKSPAHIPALKQAARSVT